VRCATSLLSIPVIGFCTFGFLATYEPPGSPILGATYCAVGLICLLVVVRQFVAKGPTSQARSPAQSRQN
jgi:hypothetical protein